MMPLAKGRTSVLQVGHGPEAPAAPHLEHGGGQLALRWRVAVRLGPVLRLALEQQVGDACLGTV